MTREEAIKILSERYSSALFSERTALETLIPELKESEGEIHEWILEYLYDGLRKSDEQFKGQFKSAIDWLENLGNMDIETYKNAEKEKSDFVGDGFIKCYANYLDFKEGETYWLEYVGKDNYNVRSDNLLGKTYHITPYQLYRLFTKEHCPKEDSVNEGTNAPTGYGKYVDECLNEASKHFFSDGEDKYSVADLFHAGVRCGKSWLEKQGEQKPKDKSKFKESEDEKMIGVIRLALTDVPEERFTTEGTSLSEVLAWLEKQKINTEGDFGRGYDCGYKACLNSHGAEFFEKQKKPTKEELYAEAGTTEKEYIANTMKIVRTMREKQKAVKTPQWMIDFLNDIRTASINKEGYDDYDGRREYEGKILAIIRWLEGNFIQQKEQKPAEWSKEDEDYYDAIITKLEVTQDDALLTDNQIDFLKSLPERFNLQPKEQTTLKYLLKRKINNIMFKLTSLSFSKLIPINSEEYRKINEITSDVCDLFDYPIEKKQCEQKLVGWSEEDEEMFDEALTGILLAKNRMNDTGCIGLAERFEKAYKWLESFRPRPHWKPSEEQMRALKIARSFVVDDFSENPTLSEILKTLYEQLKKLM